MPSYVPVESQVGNDVREILGCNFDSVCEIKLGYNHYNYCTNQ